MDNIIPDGHRFACIALSEVNIQNNQDNARIVIDGLLSIHLSNHIPMEMWEGWLGNLLMRIIGQLADWNSMIRKCDAINLTP